MPNITDDFAEFKAEDGHRFNTKELDLDLLQCHLLESRITARRGGSRYFWKQAVGAVVETRQDFLVAVEAAVATSVAKVPLRAVASTLPRREQHYRGVIDVNGGASSRRIADLVVLVVEDACLERRAGAHRHDGPGGARVRAYTVCLQYTLSVYRYAPIYHVVCPQYPSAGIY